MRYLITFLSIVILFGACSPDNENYDKGGSDTVLLNKNNDSLREKPDHTSNNELNSIEAIRAQYEKTIEAINNQKTDSSSFSFDCNGERSGTVTYYRLDGNLVMIEKKYSEYSHTAVTEKYFILNGTPHFIYQNIMNWAFDTKAQTKGDVIDKYKEKRNYIINNQLTRCLEKEYAIRSASSENPDPDKIPNKTVECPSMQDLMNEFDLLLSKKDQVAPIGCLSK